VTLHDIIGLACVVVVWVWSPLFARVRSVYPKLLGCAMCVGVWVGLAGPWLAFARLVLDAAQVGVLAFGIVTALRRLEGVRAPSEPRVVMLRSAPGAPGSRAKPGEESCCTQAAS
jgi:hypothetical protein